MMEWVERRATSPSTKRRLDAVWSPNGVGTGINLGCGGHKHPGFLNVDQYGSDHDTDLTRYPWPFPDARFDYAAAEMVLEHIPGDVSPFVEEVWRILKVGGLFYASVPYAGNQEATWGKINHYRGFMPSTFDTWIPGSATWVDYDHTWNAKPKPSFRKRLVLKLRRLQLTRYFDSYWHPQRLGFPRPNIGKTWALIFVLQKTVIRCGTCHDTGRQPYRLPNGLEVKVPCQSCETGRRLDAQLVRKAGAWAPR